jgi:hypothetical protein
VDRPGWNVHSSFARTRGSRRPSWNCGSVPSDDVHGQLPGQNLILRRGCQLSSPISRFVSKIIGSPWANEVTKYGCSPKCRHKWILNIDDLKVVLREQSRLRFKGGQQGVAFLWQKITGLAPTTISHSTFHKSFLLPLTFHVCHVTHGLLGFGNRWTHQRLRIFSHFTS